MTEPVTLDIEGLKRYGLSLNLPPIESTALDQAANSIAKRMNYLEYHYSQLEENTQPIHLVLDRFSDFRVGSGTSVRTVYEANALAFLQNLHALIDSIPYLLNIIARSLTDIEDKNIGWKKDFLKNYADKPYYGALIHIFQSQEFLMLKGLINRSKHKHIVPIRNDTRKLYLSSFSYETASKELLDTGEIVLVDFLSKCHDELIPEVFSLLDSIQA